MRKTHIVTSNNGISEILRNRNDLHFRPSVMICSQSSWYCVIGHLYTAPERFVPGCKFWPSGAPTKILQWKKRRNENKNCVFYWVECMGWFLTDALLFRRKIKNGKLGIKLNSRQLNYIEKVRTGIFISKNFKKILKISQKFEWSRFIVLLLKNSPIQNNINPKNIKKSLKKKKIFFVGNTKSV